MPTFKIEFAAKAEKELQKLPAQTAKRITKAIAKLAVNPRLGPVRPMVGISSWRLRVGDYRVIYDIQDGHLVVLVVRVRHRRDVYRD